jgi:hypothetical protein
VAGATGAPSGAAVALGIGIAAITEDAEAARPVGSRTAPPNGLGPLKGAPAATAGAFGCPADTGTAPLRAAPAQVASSGEEPAATPAVPFPATPDAVVSDRTTEAEASVFALVFTLAGPATSAERAATAVGLVSRAFTSAAMSSARSGASVEAANGARFAVGTPPPAAAKISTSPPPVAAVPAEAPNPTNIFAPGGLRSQLSRTTRSGCRPLNPTVRTLSCGSSASTVPTPVITAEHRARQRCTSLRACSPVIH